MLPVSKITKRCAQFDCWQKSVKPEVLNTQQNTINGATVAAWCSNNLLGTNTTGMLFGQPVKRKQTKKQKKRKEAGLIMQVR